MPELTAHDLTDLGVSVVGHRRKLLGAIVALRSGVGLVSGSPIAASTVERRQLTVMFCDLVGATELPRSWIRRTCARSSMRIIAPWPICCSPARRPHGDDDRPGRSKGLAGLPPFPESHGSPGRSAPRWRPSPSLASRRQRSDAPSGAVIEPLAVLKSLRGLAASRARAGYDTVAEDTNPDDRHAGVGPRGFGLGASAHDVSDMHIW